MTRINNFFSNLFSKDKKVPNDPKVPKVPNDLTLIDIFDRIKNIKTIENYNEKKQKYEELDFYYTHNLKKKPDPEENKELLKKITEEMADLENKIYIEKK